MNIKGLFDSRTFFGRRKGRPLSLHQQFLQNTLLSRLHLQMKQPAPIDLREIFSVPVCGIHLEIGFGGGEHLIHAMNHYPEKGFIGIELFQNSMVKILSNLENTPEKQQYIRLCSCDAIHVLNWLPACSVDGVDLFYPDPWLKKRHWKRRFINQENLDRFARVLKKYALFRFVSDVASYVDHTLLQVKKHKNFIWTAKSPNDWQNPFEQWPGTRYESKALRANRVPCYLTFQRI